MHGKNVNAGYGTAEKSGWACTLINRTAIGENMNCLTPDAFFGLPMY